MKIIVSSPAHFNAIYGVFGASFSVWAGYTKNSPLVGLTTLAALLSIDLIINLLILRANIKELNDTATKREEKITELEESIEDLTSKNRELKDYADKRHSFTEYELSTFKEAIEEVLDTVNTWHTPVGRDVADSQKDQYLRKSKKDLFTIINNERRANNDDRKNL